MLTVSDIETLNC